MELTLRVTPTGCVRGVFKMPNGDPIPNGVVKLRAGPWMGVLGQATTDSGAAVGQFAFDLVPLGQVRLEADDPYTARSGQASGRLEVEGRLSDPTAACLQLEVRAEGLGTVHGLVTSNDVAQPGIEMEVVSGRYRSRTVSNADGIYEIDGVPVGQVTAKAMPPGDYLAGSSTAALVEDGQVLDLPVALRDSVTVDGLVLASDGVSPGAISEVAAWGPTVPYWNPLKAYSGADGRFQMQHVPVGQTTFDGRVLQSVDRGRTVQDLQRDGSAPVPVTLQLRGVGRLRGHLRDGAGNPLPVQSAVVLQTTGDYYAYSERSFNVGEGGEFEYPDLLAGTYTVHLRADLGSGWRRGSATVEIAPVTPQDPGAWSEVTVRLEPTGAVQGRVFRPALPSTPNEPGPPAFGAVVKLTITRPDGNVIYLTDYTDANGNFNTAGVVVGRVRGTVRDNVTGGLAALPEKELASDGTVDWGDLHMTMDTLQVVSISPPDGTMNVPENVSVRVTFNLPLRDFGGIYVAGCSWPYGASLADQGHTIVLPVTCNHTTRVKVDVTSGVVDVFGRPLQTPVQSYFWTPDRTPPQVASLSPAHGAIQVSPGAQARAVYNEPLLPTQDFSSLMVCRIDRVGALVAGTTVLEGTDTVVFTPAQPLATDRYYRCAISGAIDVSGNVQYPDRWADFVTIDTVPPVALAPIPDTGSWSKDPLQGVTFRIIDSLALDESGSTLEVDGTPVPVTNQNNGGMWYVRATPWTEGWHRLVGSRVDWGGNRTTQPVDLGVDLTPPVPPTSNLQPDQTVSGTFTVSLTATDALSGVKTLHFGGWADSQAPFDFTVTPGNFADGWRTFVLKAEDQAGNTSTSNLRLYFDNHPLTTSISQPAADAPFRDSVTVTATASEPISAMDFSVAGLPSVTVSQSPYTATLPLAGAPEGRDRHRHGPGGQGETATATRAVRVDRTPPAAPDTSRIAAPAPTAGASLLTGYPGAVESSALVELQNLTAGGTATQVTAAPNGSFSLAVPASIGDQIRIVAVDSVGNRSLPSQITVSDLPPIPGGGGLSLVYVGRVVDRVGPGAVALSPDGDLDAVFTFTFSVGEGLTRQIKHVDLVGPLARSTRAAVGSILGVASGPGEAFLNEPGTGEISFPVRDGATLTLVAADLGLVQPGLTYTATAEFTDGSRFVASTTITPPEDLPTRPHTADVTVAPSTLGVTAAQPATAVVTLSNIRDIDGNLVPDGARVALSAADMASEDPRGVALRSAGGQIVDGEPAANNAAFKVFTVYGGSVTATYSSSPVDPTAVTGALALVQVLPADPAGNVLGQKAIATYDVNLRGLTDRARVYLSQPTVYADKVDRRVNVRIELLDAAGNLETGLRYVLVSATDRASNANGAPVASFGGKILGGANGPTTSYRLFSTTTGVVECEYSVEGLTVGVGQALFATIQVLDSTASGTYPPGYVARGTGTITAVGAADAEISVSPDSLPLVYPQRVAVVSVAHVHDSRLRLLPEGARISVSVADRAMTQNGASIRSLGGSILEGTTSPSGANYKVLLLEGGRVFATYQAPASTLPPGGSGISNAQLGMAGPDGAVLSWAAVAVEPIRLLAPTNAVGTAAPSWLVADGAQRVSIVTFDPVLDGWGSPVPDGSLVLASGANGAATQGGSIASAGGQILNGTPSPAGSQYRVFAVQDGAVTVQYADQGITAIPGETKTARVVLLQANASGSPSNYEAIGIVPIQLAGPTSAVITASPASLVADGGDHRVAVTLGDLKDSLGRALPDGTLVGVSASDHASTVGGVLVPSTGGTILGGVASPSGKGHKVFPVANGQVVAEYSSQGLYVGTGTKTATIQVVPINATNSSVLSWVALATRALTLTAPGAATVITSPSELNAEGSDRLSQVTVTNLLDSGGNPIPDGTKVILTVGDDKATTTGAPIASAGGEVRSAGTSPGDGEPSTTGAAYRVFTVAGGEVRAVYSALGLKPGVSQTLTARISLLPANYNSSNGTVAVASYVAAAGGTVELRGTSSATASGPASLSRGGSGQTGQVTFSGIKDSAGNTVPDGTKVIVVVRNCGTYEAGSANVCVASLGGTIVDGAASPSGSIYKVFTVAGGSVTVTYSTAGTTTTGVARVQVQPADSDGKIIGYFSLYGGVWPIQVNP